MTAAASMEGCLSWVWASHVNNQFTILLLSPGTTKQAYRKSELPKKIWPCVLYYNAVCASKPTYHILSEERGGGGGSLV